MSEFIQRMKKVAVADFHEFCEPVVALYNLVKRDFTRPSTHR
jgi:hypothetical protein